METARLLINIAKHRTPKGTVGGLHAQIREVNKLGVDDKGDMYALFAQYYDSTSEETFLADLSDKDHVFLLSDCSGQLQGFSTLAVLTHEHEASRGVRSSPATPLSTTSIGASRHSPLPGSVSPVASRRSNRRRRWIGS